MLKSLMDLLYLVLTIFIRWIQAGHKSNCCMACSKKEINQFQHVKPNFIMLKEMKWNYSWKNISEI